MRDARKVCSVAAAALWLSGVATAAEEFSYGAICSNDGAPIRWLEPSPDFAGFVYDGLRWTETATDTGPLGQGDPTTVTWGVIPDGSFIPSAFGEPSDDSDLVALLDTVYGNETVWMSFFQEAFDVWEAVTGIDFVHEPNDDGEGMSEIFPGILGVRPDVRIGGKFIDGDGGSLAYGLFPQIGEIVLDTTDTKYTDTSNDSFNLRQITMHEIGHAIGIKHVCPRTETKLMEPSFIDAFLGPQIDDISAGQQAYGDRFEPNDIDLEATDLGSLTAGATLSERLVSIDNGDDVDYYTFSVSGTEDVTVSIVPMGQIYPSEDEGGGCDASAPDYDGVRVHDLKLEVRDSLGGVVDLADAGVDGDSEQLALTLGPDTYTVFVQGSSGVDAMQLYGIWVTAGGPTMARRSRFRLPESRVSRTRSTCRVPQSA